MKAYMTKYALTEGIMEIEGGIVDTKYFSTSKNGLGHFCGPNDWQPTLQAAEKQAEAKRIRKIAALRKQLKRLEEMSFSVNELTIKLNV